MVNRQHSQLTPSSIARALFVWVFATVTIVHADSPPAERVKVAPEVTFDKVSEIFGHNLSTNEFSRKTLLLAIAMDHTTADSPHFSSKIGIPYIVHSGPSFWVNRLQSGDLSLEVLVNNALLILFTKADIPGRENGTIKLMRMAAKKGYWPADYYLAEMDLRERGISTPLLSENPAFEKGRGVSPGAINQATFQRYTRCAEMGFAPCQFRLGFWLAASPATLPQGILALRHAIRTSLSDVRYKGLDNVIVLAAKEIVFKGESAGIDQGVRAVYGQLIEKKLSVLSSSSE